MGRGLHAMSPTESTCATEFAHNLGVGRQICGIYLRRGTSGDVNVAVMVQGQARGERRRRRFDVSGNTSSPDGETDCSGERHYDPRSLA